MATPALYTPLYTPARITLQRRIQPKKRWMTVLNWAGWILCMLLPLGIMLHAALAGSPERAQVERELESVDAKIRAAREPRTHSGSSLRRQR